MKRTIFQLSETDYPKFTSLSSSLSQWLKFIPDDQEDSGLQLDNLPALFNFDFREQSTQKVDDNNKVITPAKLTVYEKAFNNLYKFGPSCYVVTDGIAGQTQLNDFLFVMPNPRKPFEQRTVPAFNKSASQSRIPLPKINTLAIPYLMACLQNTSAFGFKPNPIVLVLGVQQADGNHENLDLYLSEFATLDCNMGNISRYKMNSNAQEKGIHPDMALYHANMPSVQNQHFDSMDIDTLYDIYQRSQEEKRPLMIQCTYGTDRSGMMSFAYHLLHHWDRLFNSDNMFEVSDNIKTEHERLQQLRGPGFCVAQKSLLQGAVQLALIFKGIQISRSLCNNDDTQKTLLNGKHYMQALYILEEVKREGKHLSSHSEKLLSVLKNRAKLESAYFEEFALEIPHLSILLWNINVLLSNNIVNFTQDQHTKFTERLEKIINQYLSLGSFNEKTASDLDELYFEVSSKSLLSKIQEALKNSSPHQDELFEKETQRKSHEIVHNTDSNQIKLKNLGETYLRLEIHFRIQKIEKMLIEIKLPENDRENKRSEFNKLKKSIEGHLRSLESVIMDKRKLMKSYHLKLESFEQALEKPTNIGTAGRSTRRRVLSNPSSLKEFAKEQSVSDDHPNLSPRTSKRNEVSPTLSRTRSTSKPESPRRSLFSMFTDTSPKLTRTSEKAPEKPTNLSPRQSLSEAEIAGILPQLSTSVENAPDTSATFTRNSKKTTQASPRQSLSEAEIMDILQLSKSSEKDPNTSATLTRDSKKTTQVSPRQLLSIEQKTDCQDPLLKNSSNTPVTSNKLTCSSEKPTDKPMSSLPPLPTTSPILVRRRPSLPIQLRNDTKKQTPQESMESEVEKSKHPFFASNSSTDHSQAKADKEVPENRGFTRLPEDDFFQ